ncbi:hypothetical protein PGT21_007680 [Puccinia graminis f. sp. tritici]|uniref:Uncharacterized protein n=1 Tax=Puccinia graminis f. sp. tritici TaxID=56615 RepID=A0A5B0MM83_PUCGR|nr:hypothetical protein PGTUg99_004809 [Puccinia graminis f. sp. tritici]KAA1104027.1 hypothetical protein PGT21_007680 [Puccinia graminis f. sp. tritici]
MESQPGTYQHVPVSLRRKIINKIIMKARQDFVSKMTDAVRRVYIIPRSTLCVCTWQRSSSGLLSIAAMPVRLSASGPSRSNLAVLGRRPPFTNKQLLLSGSFTTDPPFFHAPCFVPADPTKSLI